MSTECGLRLGRELSPGESVRAQGEQVWSVGGICGHPLRSCHGSPYV